jgi:hypothetical protein
VKQVAIRLAFVVPIAMAAMQDGSGALAAQPATAVVPGCDRQCLLSVMDDFVKGMTAGRTGPIPLVEHPEVRENAIVTTLGDTTWSRVKSVRSILTIADPLTGNVVSRAGVELAAGTPG